MHLKASRARIVVLCGDRRIGHSLADRLRDCGATVGLADDLDQAFEDLVTAVQPDAVWAIVAGDDALRIGRLCRLLEVDNVTYPLPWKLYWVGADVPDGLSIIAGSFPELPRAEQIVEASRLTSMGQKKARDAGEAESPK